MTKIRVVGRIDNAQGGTIIIDKKRGLIAVRPKGRRRTYELPVVHVANMILAAVVKQELKK